MRDPERGTAAVWRGESAPGKNQSREIDALEFVSDRTDLFGIRNSKQELRLEREDTDAFGKTHLRFTQVYEGLRIWGCSKIVHFDSSGVIFMVAGQNIPTPSLGTSPAITAPAAESRAFSQISSELQGRAVRSENELVVYPSAGQPRLTWLITFLGTQGPGIRYRVFVDAISGEIVHKYNDIQFDGPAVGSGHDLDGMARSLQTYKIGLDYKLIDASRPMFKPPVSDLNGIIATYSSQHHFGGIVTDTAGDNVFDNDSGYQAAVSAHYFAEKVYDYYAATFGFNSLSNTGSSMLANVHDSIFQNNAYWDGTIVSFSDGDGVNWRPFCADLDIVGHEFTHALTEYTAGLFYEYEPGALNESMSDFFGNMIDRTNWVLGDNVRMTAPGFIRSMADPHRGPDSARFPFGNQPAVMSEFLDTNIAFDNGGVHINSGIPNHVGYLMGESIGRDKTEQIWFRTLTTYLTPNSSFQFWSVMLLQSAEDIYGPGSAEAVATTAALDSVGFGLLEVHPDSFADLRRVMGVSKDVKISIKNHRGEDVTLNSASVSSTRLSLLGSFPTLLHPGDSVLLSLRLDGTSVTQCDLGLTHDTATIYTSLAGLPQIDIPVELTTAYADVGTDTATIRSGYVISDVCNDPGMLSFGVPGLSMLNKGSLVIGWINSNDTTVYGHIDRGSSYQPVDSFTRGESANGDSLLSFRFMSNDGVIHGKVQYRYKGGITTGILPIIADYWITKPCGDPINVYSGTYMDWDVDDKFTNVVDFVGLITHDPWGDTLSRGLQIVKSPQLGVSVGQMLLFNDIGPTGEQSDWVLGWGYRTVWLWLYDHFGFRPQLLFRDLTLDPINHKIGDYPDDWASLALFGEKRIGPGDTLRASVAYMWNVGNDSGYFDQFANIPPTCCTDVTGNIDCDPDGRVDISDITRLIDRLYLSFAPFCCTAQANVDGEPGTDIGDLNALIDYLYISFTPPRNCVWWDYH